MNDRKWATKLLADLQFIGRDPVETVLAALAKRDAERDEVVIQNWLCAQEPSNADPR